MNIGKWPDARQLLAALGETEGMAWKIAAKLRARNPHAPWLDVCELHAEVSAAFKYAAMLFDPARGVKFGTYAYRAGWNAGLSWLRQELARGMHVPASHAITCVFHVGLPGEAHGDLVGDRAKGDAPAEYPADFWEDATVGLTDGERAVLVGVYRDGRRQTEVGRELGVSKSRANQFHASAVKKLKAGRRLAKYLDAA